MQMEIPENVKYIIDELYAHGFEAFAVGGCVRDSILHRVPGDWDITTSARPLDVKRIFRRTIDTGIEHGTVTVMIESAGYEVTTYRVDGDYVDHRHPTGVEFTASLEEDLKRRDFTINAMAYNDRRGLIDLFDGIGDIKRKVIRCVGDACQRFDEDALRILRAVRFSAQLGFNIEETTAQAMKVKSPDLQHISAERIQTELVKLLVSDHPEYIHKAYELGITSVILPEYDGIVGVEQHTPNHIYTVEVHTLKALENIEPVPALRLTMLMHDFGKPAVKQTRPDGRDIFYRHPEVSAQITKKIMKRLKFDNHTMDTVVRLVQWHGLKYESTEYHLRQALNRVGRDLFDDFLKVQTADVLGKSPAVIEKKLVLLKEKRAVYEKVIREDQCFEIKKLAVNGKDLIAAGINPGPLLGAVLERLLDKVIENQSLNTKEQLLELAVKVKDDADIFEERPAFFC